MAVFEQQVSPQWPIPFMRLSAEDYRSLSSPR